MNSDRHEISFRMELHIDISETMCAVDVTSSACHFNWKKDNRFVPQALPIDPNLWLTWVVDDGDRNECRDDHQDAATAMKICNTMNFECVIYSYLYNTATRWVTLCILHAISVVYRALQTPPSGAKLLVIIWNTPSEWQVRKFSMHRGTRDSSSRTGWRT